MRHLKLFESHNEVEQMFKSKMDWNTIDRILTFITKYEDNGHKLSLHVAAGCSGSYIYCVQSFDDYEETDEYVVKNSFVEIKYYDKDKMIRMFDKCGFGYFIGISYLDDDTLAMVSQIKQELRKRFSSQFEFIQIFDDVSGGKTICMCNGYDPDEKPAYIVLSKEN